MIRTELTTVYPTRYQAFEHPGVLWEAAERKERGGFEAAVFYLPMPNAECPQFTDGVYAEIVSYQGRWWLADVRATRPSAARPQWGRRMPGRPTSYEAARAWLLQAIPEAVEWAEE